MSASNIPKAVLAAPNKEERGEDSSLAALRGARFYEMVRANAEESLEEMHQDRIKNLRKEIDYLKETEWKYESSDKYIGQC